MKLYLHIYHLDPGDEEVLINSLLTNDGVLSNFVQEGQTSDGNGIAIYIGDFSQSDIKDRTLQLLNMLSKETLATIEELFLSVSLRLVVNGGISAFFDQDVLRLATSKGIDIYVFNQQNV
jgi:hypothetical protein